MVSVCIVWYIHRLADAPPTDRFHFIDVGSRISSLFHSFIRCHGNSVFDWHVVWVYQVMILVLPTTLSVYALPPTHPFYPHRRHYLTHLTCHVLHLTQPVMAFINHRHRTLQSFLFRHTVYCPCRGIYRYMYIFNKLMDTQYQCCVCVECWVHIN